MASLGLEVLGVTLAVLGWISSIVSCVLPMWKVTAHVGANSLTTEVSSNGLWMKCIHRSTGIFMCENHKSMLNLSADVQVARSLTVISILMGLLGLLLAILAARCNTCMDKGASKSRVMVAAGVILVLASLTQLVPVSWSTSSIIKDFYDPVIPEEQKMELGAALYLGWAAAAFLLLGGGLLCSSCPQQPEKRYGTPSTRTYSPDQSVAPGVSEKKDYV